MRPSWPTRWLILCALAMRVLVPAGFMLGASPAHALPVLMPCPAAGALPAAMEHAAMAGMHHDSGKSGEHQDSGSDHPCAFAAAGAAAALTAPVVPLAIVYHPEPAPLRVAGVMRPGLGLAAPPPPQTGPPILR